MKVKPINYFLKSFEEIGLIGKHFNVYNVCDDLIREDCYINENGYACTGSNELWSITMGLLTGLYSYKIILQKKKLRDWTLEDFEKWKDKNCNYRCGRCLFSMAVCNDRDCWVNHKDFYSNKFLDREIEVEE